MKIKIFLDLDDVLADFVGQSLLRHGVTRRIAEGYRRRGEWDLLPILSRLYGYPVTEEDFWEPIQLAGERFWTGLPLLPGSKTLIEWLTKKGIEWSIATAPGPYPESYSGKVKWVSAYFGKEALKRTVLIHDKTLLADANSILIDDREATVERFILEGGKGITFPAKQNTRGYDTDCIDSIRGHQEVIKDLTLLLF